MELSLRSVTSRRGSTGLLGGILFFVGAMAVLLVLAVLAAMGLFAVAVLGVLIGVDRLLGLLVPAYRRRRRARSLTVPAGLVRVVRFGSVRDGTGPAQVIDARSHELPHER